MGNLTGQIVHQKGVTRRRMRTAEQIEDAKYLAWLRTQPSAKSGKKPCEACHYRTAANSGTGIKPLLSAIPLTRDEHREQHQIGQFSFMPRWWWEKEVALHLARFRASK